MLKIMNIKITNNFSFLHFLLLIFYFINHLQLLKIIKYFLSDKSNYQFILNINFLEFINLIKIIMSQLQILFNQLIIKFLIMAIYFLDALNQI